MLDHDEVTCDQAEQLKDSEGLSFFYSGCCWQPFLIMQGNKLVNKDRQPEVQRLYYYQVTVSKVLVTAWAGFRRSFHNHYCQGTASYVTQQGRHRQSSNGPPTVSSSVSLCCQLIKDIHTNYLKCFVEKAAAVSKLLCWQKHFSS